MLKRILVEKYIYRLKELFPVVKPPLYYKTDFQFLVAVVLSARTTDRQVNKITPELFRKFPDAESFAKAELSDIEKALSSIGLYKSKAANIKKLSQIIVREYKGKLPLLRQDLEKLPGVGRKTANVILSTLAGDNSGVVVDTHVLRLAKLLLLSNKDDPIGVEQDLLELIPARERRDFALRLIFYGRKFCPAGHARSYNKNHFSCPLTMELRDVLQSVDIGILSAGKYRSLAEADQQKLAKVGFSRISILDLEDWKRVGKIKILLVYADEKDWRGIDQVLKQYNNEQIFLWTTPFKLKRNESAKLQERNIFYFDNSFLRVCGCG